MTPAARAVYEQTFGYFDGIDEDICERIARDVLATVGVDADTPLVAYETMHAARDQLAHEVLELRKQVKELQAVVDARTRITSSHETLPVYGTEFS